MSRAKRELDYDNQEFATRKDRAIYNLQKEVRTLKTTIIELQKQLDKAQDTQTDTLDQF